MDWSSSSGSSGNENISSVCQQNQPSQLSHDSPAKGKNKKDKLQLSSTSLINRMIYYRKIF